MGKSEHEKGNIAKKSAKALIETYEKGFPNTFKKMPSLVKHKGVYRAKSRCPRKIKKKLRKSYITPVQSLALSIVERMVQFEISSRLIISQNKKAIESFKASQKHNCYVCTASHDMTLPECKECGVIFYMGIILYRSILKKKK